MNGAFAFGPRQPGLDQADAVLDRTGDERQARHDIGDPRRAPVEGAVEVVGIAADDGDAGEALGEEAAEVRAVLDGDDARRDRRRARSAPW